MTVGIWEPGKLYINGDLARPRRKEAAGPASLADGDFEAATVGTVLTPRWSVANDAAFTGAKSIKFQGGTSDTGEYILPDRIACKPGESVTASCMFNQGAASKNNAGGAIRIYWFGAGGAQVGLKEGNIIKSGGGWFAQTTATDVVPANATHFGVGVNGFHNGSGQPMWADHFVINYTPSAPALNPLIYKAVQADPGTSAGTEPDWPTTLGATVVDGGVTWEAIGTGYIVWRAEPNLRSGATEPTWPVTEGESVSDGTIVWEARTTRVTDPKCPNSKVVAIIASKVFAVDGDIIRYSATANALDWSTPRDAGYLPSGLQQANSNDMAVLQPYRSNLCAWNASSFQMWQVDPDPEQMAILDQMDGVGSTWQWAAQPVGNDLYFLSQRGVRSVGIAVGGENLAVGDIGSPIDSLVSDDLASATKPPRSTYYPGAGQYWLTISLPSGSTATHVFTRNGPGPGKWSRYVFPFSIEGFQQLGDALYIRSGDTIKRVSESAVTDIHNGVEVPFSGAAQWSWLDFGQPGTTKMLEGFDVVTSGSPSVSIGWDQSSPLAFTTPYAVPADTVPGNIIPLPLSGPSFSLRVDFAAGEKWELQSAALYVHDNKAAT